MKLIVVQSAQKLVLGLITGIVEIDSHVGRGQTLLALQSYTTLRAPGEECAGEDINVIRVKRRVDRHKHSLHHSLLELVPDGLKRTLLWFWKFATAFIARR